MRRSLFSSRASLSNLSNFATHLLKVEPGAHDLLGRRQREKLRPRYVARICARQLAKIVNGCVCVTRHSRISAPAIQQPSRWGWSRSIIRSEAPGLCRSDIKSLQSRARPRRHLQLDGRLELLEVLRKSVICLRLIDVQLAEAIFRLCQLALQASLLGRELGLFGVEPALDLRKLGNFCPRGRDFIMQTPGGVLLSAATLTTSE